MTAQMTAGPGTAITNGTVVSPKDSNNSKLHDDSNGAAGADGGGFAQLLEMLVGSGPVPEGATTAQPGGVPGTDGVEFLPADGKVMPSSVAQLSQDGDGSSPLIVAAQPYAALTPAGGPAAEGLSQATGVLPPELGGATVQGSSGNGRAIPIVVGEVIAQASDGHHEEAQLSASLTGQSGGGGASTTDQQLARQLFTLDRPQDAQQWLQDLAAQRLPGGGPVQSSDGGLAGIQAAVSLMGMHTAAAAQPTLDRGTVQLPVNVPFNHPQWGAEMGSQVRWMATQQMQSAEIHINPPQLGPLEVRISMQNEQLHVMFTTHHSMVRDAVEEALPRLRDIFQEQGLNLGNLDVSHQSNGDRPRGFTTQGGVLGDESADPELAIPSAETDHGPPGGRVGLVDYFA